MFDEDSSHGEDTQGAFAVKLSFDNGVSAVLTGEHFNPDEIEVARIIVANESKESVACGGSPVYLVRDSVMRLALSARRNALRTMSECSSGTCGEPCGDCDTCRSAERDAFTRVILGAIELPEGDLTERLREVVSSVIGMTWSDAYWEQAMTEEEVDEVLTETGTTKKGTEE